MRKVLIAAASFVALAGAAGLALAQQDSVQNRPFGLFQADSNSDGTVTQSEYEASRAARFDTLDANNDGQLTREEMRAERGEHGRGGHHRGGHHGMRGGLEHADANDDGSITREEFFAGPSQMFARLDNNNDGVVSADERPQRRERGERQGRRHADANNDGVISQSEFVAMSASHFERLDSNDDGQVTREEADAARGQRHGH
jgi:Ca2+-binding EF-hand superfamily protein